MNMQSQMRSRNARPVLRLAAAALVAALLTACGGGGQPSKPAGQPSSGPAPAAATAGPQKGGVLRVAMIGEPPTLDLQWTTAVITYQITWHIYETLFSLGEKYDATPHLVESHAVSPDGKTYTFKLRQGVPFHNGKEMTADDVAASLKRWAKLSGVGKTVLKDYQAIDARDKYTVELRLKEPSGALLIALASPNQGAAIHPKEVIDEAGNGQLKQFIGTGPFKFVERQPDRFIKLARFDQYKPRSEPANGFGGKREAYVDEIRFIPVPDIATRVAGLESGEYDVVESANTDDYDRLKSNPKMQTFIIKPTSYATAVFNKKQGMFTNQKLRQAMLAALDMEPIMAAAMGTKEFYRIDPGLMFKEQAWWSDAGSQGAYNQKNAARARQLAQEAGYKGETIRWLTTKEYDWNYKSTAAAKQQLEAAGFKIELVVTDWATLVTNRAKPETYEIFTTGISMKHDPTQVVYLPSNWPGWWDSKKKNDLLAQLSKESEFNKRKQIWEELNKLYWEEVPVIKFGDYFSLRVASKNVKNFQPAPDMFLWNVWLEKK